MIDILPTPDMTERSSQEFVEGYTLAMRETIKDFGRTPSYESDTMMKVLATAWLAGVEQRPMIVSEFSTIRYHGGNQERNPVRAIETHLAPHIGGLALKHDEDFALYHALYKRFSGANPLDVTPQEQR